MAPIAGRGTVPGVLQAPPPVVYTTTPAALVRYDRPLVRPTIVRNSARSIMAKSKGVMDLGNNIWRYINSPLHDVTIFVANTTANSPRTMTAGIYNSGVMQLGSAGRTTSATTGTLPLGTINTTDNVSVALSKPGDADWLGSATFQINSSNGPQTITYTGLNSSGFTGCTGGSGSITAGSSLIGPAQRPTGGKYNGWLQVMAQDPLGWICQGGGTDANGNLLWTGDGGILSLDSYVSRLVLGGIAFVNTSFNYGSIGGTQLSLSGTDPDRVILWYTDHQDYTGVTAWQVFPWGIVTFGPGGAVTGGPTNCGWYGPSLHDIKTSSFFLKRATNCVIQGMTQKNVLLSFETGAGTSQPTPDVNHMDGIEMISTAGTCTNNQILDSMTGAGFRHPIICEGGGTSNPGWSGNSMARVWMPVNNNVSDTTTHRQFATDAGAGPNSFTMDHVTIWAASWSSGFGSAITSPGYVILQSGGTVTVTVTNDSLVAPTMDAGHSALSESDILADSHNPANIWRTANPYYSMLSYLGNSSNPGGGWT